MFLSRCERGKDKGVAGQQTHESRGERARGERGNAFDSLAGNVLIIASSAEKGTRNRGTFSGAPAFAHEKGAPFPKSAPSRVPQIELEEVTLFEMNQRHFDADFGLKPVRSRGPDWAAFDCGLAWPKRQHNAPEKRVLALLLWRQFAVRHEARMLFLVRIFDWPIFPSVGELLRRPRFV